MHCIGIYNLIDVKYTNFYKLQVDVFRFKQISPLNIKITFEFRHNRHVIFFSVDPLFFIDRQRVWSFVKTIFRLLTWVVVCSSSKQAVGIEQTTRQVNRLENYSISLALLIDVFRITKDFRENFFQVF